MRPRLGAADLRSVPWLGKVWDMSVMSIERRRAVAAGIRASGRRWEETA